MFNHQIPGWVWACCCLACCAGCTSTKSSNTLRTGTEQLLVSNAVDQALSRVDFSPFAKRKIFVEEKYIECVDKAYVISSLRHHLWRHGAEIVVKIEDAEIVVEPRSGAVGTDTSDAFVGTPQFALPGMLTIPEIKLITRSTQTGTAKLGIVAYDAKTRESLGDGGTALARSSDHNWYVLGIGPYQSGTVKQEVKSAGVTEWGASGWMLPSNVAFHWPLKINSDTDETAAAEEVAPATIKLTSQEEAFADPGAKPAVTPATPPEPTTAPPATPKSE